MRRPDSDPCFTRPSSPTMLIFAWSFLALLRQCLPCQQADRAKYPPRGGGRLGRFDFPCFLAVPPHLFPWLRNCFSAIELDILASLGWCAKGSPGIPVAVWTGAGGPGLSLRALSYPWLAHSSGMIHFSRAVPIFPSAFFSGEDVFPEGRFYLFCFSL